MHCLDEERLVAAIAENATPSDALREHLTNCEECRRIYGDALKMLHLVAEYEVFEQSLAGEVDHRRNERIIESVTANTSLPRALAKRQSKGRLRSQSNWRWTIAFCAGVVLFLSLGVTAGFYWARSRVQLRSERIATRPEVQVSLCGEFETDGLVTALCFSRDNRLLATGDDVGQIRIWDVTAGELTTSIAEDEKSRITSLLFTSDGQSLQWTQTALMAGSSTTQVKSRGLEKGADTVLLVERPGYNPVLHWSIDQKLMLLDTHEGRTSFGILSDSPSFAFRPQEGSNSSPLYSGASDPEDQILYEEAPAVTLTGMNGKVESAAFSADGRRLVIPMENDRGNWIGYWDGTTGRLMRAIPVSMRVAQPTMAPDGRLLATTSHDADVKIWNVATGRDVANLPNTSDTTCVAFSWDGRILASGNREGKVHLWNPVLGQLQATWSGHEEAITAMIFSPDGSMLASASTDKSVCLWRLTIPTGEQRKK